MSARGLALVAAVLVASSAASADEVPRIDVEVGKTVERAVGYATGWFCDDASLVRAEVVTRNDTNVWVVTGVKQGTTQCRVGTDLARVHYVFEVRVTPAKSRRP